MQISLTCNASPLGKIIPEKLYVLQRSIYSIADWGWMTISLVEDEQSGNQSSNTGIVLRPEVDLKGVKVSVNVQCFNIESLRKHQVPCFLTSICSLEVPHWCHCFIYCVVNDIFKPCFLRFLLPWQWLGRGTGSVPYFVVALISFVSLPWQGLESGVGSCSGVLFFHCLPTW